MHLFCGMIACASGGNLSLDSIAKQVDYLDVYFRNVEPVRKCRIPSFFAWTWLKGRWAESFIAPAIPPAISASRFGMETEISIHAD
ncbi:hypothetical protein NKJ84_28265 [Mesorhizobium sp. M0048]|uniref:hypothetical protein n=1 Tax=Mesorhizobium sp. M0048 TaxID=2956860 RepID=UPI003336EDE8